MVLLCTELDLCAKIDIFLALNSSSSTKHLLLTQLSVLKLCYKGGGERGESPYAGYTGLIYESAKDALLSLADQVCIIVEKGHNGSIVSAYRQYFHELETTLAMFPELTTATSAESEGEKIVAMFENAFSHSQSK